MIMTLRVWEIWDAEERELKRLSKLKERLRERLYEDDWRRKEVESVVQKIECYIEELDNERLDKRSNYKEKEKRLLLLEEIMWKIMKEEEHLKSVCEEAENEKLKLELVGGIRAFEFAINLIRQEMELLAMRKWITRKVLERR